MAGAGCRWSETQVALRNFAEHTGIPVVTHSGGRGTLPDSHPLSVFPGFYAGLRADAVLLLGVRLDFMMGYGRMFPKPMKVIQVDIDPSRLGLNRGPDCAVAGDIANRVMRICQFVVSPLHTPARHIVHRRSAYQFLKPFCKCGPGQIGGIRQALH